MEHWYETLPQEFNGTTFDPLGWPLTGEWAPREALFVKLLWPLVRVTQENKRGYFKHSVFTHYTHLSSSHRFLDGSKSTTHSTVDETGCCVICQSPWFLPHIRSLCSLYVEEFNWHFLRYECTSRLALSRTESITNWPTPFRLRRLTATWVGLSHVQ